MNDKIDLVLHAINGRGQFGDMWERLRSTPLRYVFQARNFHLGVGEHPCEGHEWVNTSGSINFSGDPIETLSNWRLAKLVSTRRRKLINEMVPLFVENLVSKTGTDDPTDEWVTIALRRWWLRHTFVPPELQTKGPAVFLDCTYAFVPRKEWLEKSGRMMRKEVVS